MPDGRSRSFTKRLHHLPGRPASRSRRNRGPPAEATFSFTSIFTNKTNNLTPTPPGPSAIREPRELPTMPSPAQYAANRLNALKSTGPATPQGKARSSMNALRHGLTARVVVLPSEDMAAYKTFSTEIVDSLDAQTPVESQFAQTVADNMWRINRIRSIEDGMFGLGHFEAAADFAAPNPEVHAVMTAAKAFRAHSQAFVNLSICEQRLHRATKEALRQLKELQAERRERSKTETPTKTETVAAVPPQTTPEPAEQEIGSVFAVPGIALETTKVVAFSRRSSPPDGATGSYSEDIRR